MDLPQGDPRAPGASGRVWAALAILLDLWFGIGLAVLCLRFYHVGLGCNLYAANFLAILLVTGWSFWLNARFNWRTNSER